MDASTLELAVQIAHKNGHNSVFASIVDDGMILKDKKVAIVSNYALEIFIQEKQELKWLKSTPWIDIKSVNYNKKRVLLKFKNDSYRLFTEDHEKLFGAVYHVLMQLLTPEEIKDTGFSKYVNNYFLQTNAGAISRLVQLVDTYKGHVDRKSITQLKQSLIFNESVLDLNKFNNPQSIIRFVLDILPLCCNYNSFMVPYIDNLDYKMLYSYTKHFSRLHYLQFSGKSQQKFKHFVEAFQNEEIIPSGFSFTDREFTVNGMKQLERFISTKKITSLGLHRAFSAESLEYFYTEFFTPSVNDTLVSLDLSGTTGVNLSRLIPQLPQIMHLSLENCGYQVSDIIMCLGAPSMHNLRVIDMSGSVCAHLPDETAQLPANLEKIIADNVRWGQESMKMFIRILSNKLSCGLNLSVANASMDDNDWDLAFLEFDRSQFTYLSSLRWNGNPVDSRLFDFLLRNTELKTLDVSGCFNSNEIDVLEMLCEFITMHIGLQELFVAGNDDFYIGESISLLCHAVNQSKTIKLVDLSNNKIGDKGLVCLKQLFRSSTSLEVIDFDGSEPQIPEDFIAFLEFVANFSNIKVSFPVNDMSQMLQNKSINYTTSDRILNLFKRKQNLNVNAQCPFTVPKNSPLFDPFIVFKLERLQQFPLFIKRDEVDNMKASQSLQVVNRTVFTKRISKICRSKPIFNGGISKARNNNQYNISMMDDMSDSSSDEFDTRDLQVRVSINSLMPNFQQIKENSPIRKESSTDSLQRQESTEYFSRKSSFQSIEIPNEDELIMPPETVHSPEQMEKLQKTVENSIFINDSLSLPKPPSPKSPKLQPNAPIPSIVDDLFIPQPITDTPSQLSVTPVPPEYASRIPHTSAYNSRPISGMYNESIDDYYDDEESYDDMSYNTGRTTSYIQSNSQYKSGLLKFEGCYEYYSESEDDIDEEEESDFFTTPPSTPGRDSPGNTHDFANNGMEAYDSYGSVQLSTEQSTGMYTYNTNNKSTDSNTYDSYRMRSSDDFNGKLTLDDSSKTESLSTNTERRRQRRTRTHTEEAKEEDDDVQVKNVHESKFYGSRVNRTQSELRGSSISGSRSSIYGSRRRNRDNQENFVPAPPLPISKVQQESSYYSSRKQSQMISSPYSSKISEAAPTPEMPKVAINPNESHHNASRRRSRAYVAPVPRKIPSVEVEEMDPSIYGNSQDMNVSRVEKEAKESGIYGSRVNRRRMRPVDSQALNESSSIYGSRVRRQKQDQTNQSIEVSTGASVRRRRGAPPPEPVVRSVRSRARVRKVAAANNANENEENSTNTSESYDMQRPPPIKSPKTTITMTTTINSPKNRRI